jgi:signal transduction histidine kinase
LVKILFLQSIRFKTSLLFFVVFLIISVPVNFIIYNKVKKVIETADSKELKLEAEKLLNQVRLDPKQIPLPKQGYFEKIQLNREIYFENIFTSPSFPELDQAIYFLENYQQDTLVFVTLKREIEYSAGVVLLTLMRSDEPLRSALEELKRYLFYANAASIFLAGLLVYVVTGISLAPVKKIVSAAQHINAANSMERVPAPTSRDEYQQLAEAINAMLLRMETSIKTQTNFFASAAHELKTPLTVMRAELSLALQQTGNSETIKILVSNLREVQRLDHIIHNFLLISQLKTETLVLRKQPVELDEIIFAALKKSNYLAHERGSSVKVHLAEKPFYVQVDVDMMETVIGNLVENALNYSDHGAIILIELTRLENTLELTVANDTKSSIPDLNRLTEEFYKVEPQSSGLGLGLWICKRILTMHQTELTLSHVQQRFMAKFKLQSRVADV